MISMMCKCIMGESKGEAKRNEKERKYEEFINFAEIARGICNMHHWLKGMDAPGCL